jgi:hypothetical protein
MQHAPRTHLADVRMREAGKCPDRHLLQSRPVQLPTGHHELDRHVDALEETCSLGIRHRARQTDGGGQESSRCLYRERQINHVDALLRRRTTGCGTKGERSGRRGAGMQVRAP